MKRFALLSLSALLAGCGSREPLQPPEGGKTPPKPALAARAATTDELLTSTTLARPDRVDELLTKSEPRQDDRFDLPPSNVPPGTAPVAIPPEQPQ